MKLQIKLTLTTLAISTPAFAFACTTSKKVNWWEEKDVITIKYSDISNFSDGDTIYINETWDWQNSNGITEKKTTRGFRTHGIDTSEMTEMNILTNVRENTTGNRRRLAEEAKEEAVKLTQDKTIYFKKIETDHYGRYVGIWYLKSDSNEKIDIAKQLVIKGLAVVANINSANYPDYYYELRDAEKIAYDSNIGIWEFKNDLKSIFPKFTHNSSYF